MTKKNINKIIKGITCFSAHEKLGVDCQKKSCRCWFDNPETKNCVILCAKRKGPQKQEQIGKYFNLTRMRVCQIEKGIIEKARKIAEEETKIISSS